MEQLQLAPLIEEEKIELNEQAEFFYPLISRIVYSFESHAISNHIHFSVNYETDKELQLLVDKAKLETIINNLLSNALKFTQVNGKVKTIIKDNGKTIQIAISDTGRGIHPNDIHHVFGRFNQSRQPNAPTEGGTGIGLALASQLAELMKGKIWVESEWGKGTTFYVELPKKEVDILETPENSFDSQTTQTIITVPKKIIIKANDRKPN